MILTVNAGSSSVKITLFNSCEKLLRVADWQLNKCDSDVPSLEFNGNISHLKGPLSDSEAFTVLYKLVNELIGNKALVAVVHRFVHGGERYRVPIYLDDDVIENLSKLLILAPLHNGRCLAGIQAAKMCFASNIQIKQWVVFDTSFFSSLPKVSTCYALPQAMADKFQIRRYGFHGISHAYVWKLYAGFTQNSKAKIITLHLGNGCSMAAIQEGLPVDTSMGLTPCEGLVMGTRCGDIDVAVVEMLADGLKISISEVIHKLNFDSGLLGLSGISHDMRILLEKKEDNPKAALAIDLFCYRIVKYIGCYVAALGGADALVFSGGIGENSVYIRKRVIEASAWSGALLDADRNAAATHLKYGEIFQISSTSSKIAIYIAATDENLAMAEEIQMETYSIKP